MLHLRAPSLVVPFATLSVAAALGACALGDPFGASETSEFDDTEPTFDSPPERESGRHSVEDATARDVVTDRMVAEGSTLDVNVVPDGFAIDAPAESAVVVPEPEPEPEPEPPLDCSVVGPSGAPRELGCTGLYASWPSRTIASTARPFAPAVTLWSDGAVKTRFIQLPAGKTIDTSNMDEWRFPVGTKVWKEFRLRGKLVETRFMWKQTASNWYRTTYAWSADQKSAVETTAGVVDVWGTGYDIPAQSECVTCHNGHLDGVLGFEVIGLSNPGASGLTMSALVAQNLVTHAPSEPPIIPGNAVERAALGWLHANCGSACHSDSNYALARSSGLHMRLTVSTVSSVQATDTWRTAVNVPSKFQGPGGGFYRIRPREVAKSSIPYRDGYRDTKRERIQMPPLGTRIVDAAGLKAVNDWIESM